MTEQKQNRPTSNILNKNESDSNSSTRPQSNINTTLQASNESASFDSMSINVLDEKSVADSTKEK